MENAFESNPWFLILIFFTRIFFERRQNVDGFLKNASRVHNFDFKDILDNNILEIQISFNKTRQKFTTWWVFKSYDLWFLLEAATMLPLNKNFWKHRTICLETYGTKTFDQGMNISFVEKKNQKLTALFVIVRHRLELIFLFEIRTLKK